MNVLPAGVCSVPPCLTFQGSGSGLTSTMEYLRSKSKVAMVSNAIVHAHALTRDDNWLWRAKVYQFDVPELARLRPVLNVALLSTWLNSTSPTWKARRCQWATVH